MQSLTSHLYHRRQAPGSPFYRSRNQDSGKHFTIHPKLTQEAPGQVETQISPAKSPAPDHPFTWSLGGVNRVRPILIIFYLFIECFPWPARRHDLYIVDICLNSAVGILCVKLDPEKKRYSIFNELMRNSYKPRKEEVDRKIRVGKGCLFHLCPW